MHPQSETTIHRRVAALDETRLVWAGRIVWAVCIGVYLTVFIGGILAGGAELITIGRAAGFTLVAAVLGKIALNLLSSANLPMEQGPMAAQEGTLGSLADLAGLSSVPQHQDDARAGLTGER